MSKQAATVIFRVETSQPKRPKCNFPHRDFQKCGARSRSKLTSELARKLLQRQRFLLDTSIIYQMQSRTGDFRIIRQI
jgi:hypothetical protein